MQITPESIVSPREIKSNDRLRIIRGAAGSQDGEISVDILLPPADGNAAFSAVLETYCGLREAGCPLAPQVLSVSPDGSDNPFVAIKTPSGKSLYGIVAKDGALGTRSVLRVARSVAGAMQSICASFRCVNRNIKPDNLFIDEKGHIVIGDFTLATVPPGAPSGAEDEGLSITGTPNYISPEQVAGASLDERSDMYSLGMTLYFLATGKAPFGSASPEEVLSLQRSGALDDPRLANPSLSDSAASLIHALTMKDRINRHASWEDVLADIALAEAGKPLAIVIPKDAPATVPCLPRRRAPAATPQKAQAMRQQAPRRGEGMGGAAYRQRMEALTGQNKKPSPPVAVRFVLWTILLAWFLVLWNARIGNPAKIAQLDFLAEKLAERPPVHNGGVRLVMPAGNPAPGAAKRPAAHAAASRPAKQDAEKPRPPSSQAAKQKPAAEEEPDVLSWSAPVLEKIAKRDFAAAARLARESKTATGLEVAQMLDRVPDAGVAVAREIMKHEGRSVEITYMGKQRELVPISASGSHVTTSFNGRTVTIDASTLSPVEMLKWLEETDGAPGHVLALAFALEISDRSATLRHAQQAGPAIYRLIGK